MLGRIFEWLRPGGALVLNFAAVEEEEIWGEVRGHGMFWSGWGEEGGWAGVGGDGAGEEVADGTGETIRDLGGGRGGRDIWRGGDDDQTLIGERRSTSEGTGLEAWTGDGAARDDPNRCHSFHLISSARPPARPDPASLPLAAWRAPLPKRGPDRISAACFVRSE